MRVSNNGFGYREISEYQRKRRVPATRRSTVMQPVARKISAELSKGIVPEVLLAGVVKNREMVDSYEEHRYEEKGTVSSIGRTSSFSIAV